MLNVLAISLILIVIVVWVKIKQAQSEVPDLFVSYKVVVPAYGDGPTDAKSFYRHLHSLLGDSSSKIVLEIISTPSTGIYYLVSVPLSISQSTKEYLVAYWPSMQIEKVKDSQTIKLEPKQCYWSKQWRFGKAMDEQPISYLFASMRGLKTGEAIAWQIILKSQYEDLLSRATRSMLRVFISSIKLISHLLLAILITPDRARQLTMSFAMFTDSRADAKLFRASFRSVIIASNDKRLGRLTASIESSICSYGFKSYMGEDDLSNFINRIPSRLTETSVDLMSNVFSFPGTNKLLDEDLAQSKALLLPASTAMKTKSKHSLVLGVNNHTRSLLTHHLGSWLLLLL